MKEKRIDIKEIFKHQLKILYIESETELKLITVRDKSTIKQITVSKRAVTREI